MKLFSEPVAKLQYLGAEYPVEGRWLFTNHLQPGTVISVYDTRKLEDLEVAVAQAVEFAEYVESHAKGTMVEAAKRFLSQPFAEELRARLHRIDPIY